MLVIITQPILKKFIYGVDYPSIVDTINLSEIRNLWCHVIYPVDIKNNLWC
jgi:hypothetical protein